MIAVIAFVNAIFEPGFFTSEPVRVALVVGGAVSLVSAVVGVFTVIRGQSFAGHSMGDLGTAGGSGAFLVGANPLWGFVTFAVLGAGAMELFGARRPRGRDTATGIVLDLGSRRWSFTSVQHTATRPARPSRSCSVPCSSSVPR